MSSFCLKSPQLPKQKPSFFFISAKIIDLFSKLLSLSVYGKTCNKWVVWQDKTALKQEILPSTHWLPAKKWWSPYYIMPCIIEMKPQEKNPNKNHVLKLELYYLIKLSEYCLLSCPHTAVRWIHFGYCAHVLFIESCMHRVNQAELNLSITEERLPSMDIQRNSWCQFVLFQLLQSASQKKSAPQLW